MLFTCDVISDHEASDDEDMTVKNGEVVDVMDDVRADRWLCRRHSDVTQSGLVPPGVLTRRDRQSGLKKRTQEQFREDVLQIQDKDKEALVKRRQGWSTFSRHVVSETKIMFCRFRYAVKDMWESEQQYIKELSFALNTYDHKLPLDDLPKQFHNRDTFSNIFRDLGAIKSFHDE